MAKRNLTEHFEHLYKAISSNKFLNMEALGGEIPFFITSYPAAEANAYIGAVAGLINKLETRGISVLNINLYDISIEIIKKEIGLQEFFELEKEMDKEEFKDALQSILDIHLVLVPEIKKQIDSSNAQVYFITGVGEVFPFIRSHNILNNLQNVAKDAPTVMFFPGVYDGQSLSLFGLLKDDNYYRAFNLDTYKA